MKQLFISTIFLLILSVAVCAAGDIAIYPGSDSGTGYFGDNITKTVRLTNINATNSRQVTLPTSVVFTGASTLPISMLYNTTGPVTIPASSSVDITYTIRIPSSAVLGDYTGTIHFGDSTNYGEIAFALKVQGKLYMDDLDVSVDRVIEDETEKDKNIDDGDKISAEARPGSIVKFDFKLGNSFTDDEDIEIQNIVIEVTIVDVDDGDDLEEESDDFDINADDTGDRVEMEFEIPLEVEEGDYTVRIVATGEDDNDVDHEIEWELELEIEKESHLIHILEASVSPDTVSCDRSTSLDVGLINLGSRNEDEVILEISNSALGVDIERKELELDEDYDDDNTYDETYTIDVANDVPAGTYSILVKTYYKEGKLSETETVDLIVEECDGTPTTPTQTTTPTTTTQPTQTTTTQPTQTTTTQPTIINPPVITTSDSSDDSFWDSPIYVIILVLVNVVGIAVLIVIITKTLLKKQ